MIGSTSRRALLGASAAVVAGVGTSPAPAEAVVPTAAPSVPGPASTDAELIADCEQWLWIKAEFERRTADLLGDVPDDHPAWSLFGPQGALEERIIAATATTAEGQYARLRCAAWAWLPEAEFLRDRPGMAFEDRLERAMHRDVVAGRGA